MRMLAGLPVLKRVHFYSVTPVTSAAWVEIISSLEKPASAVEIFSASGSTIKISTGLAGDEDSNEIPYYVLPGGSGIMLPIGFSKGSRISLRSIDLAADAGSIVLNFFG